MTISAFGLTGLDALRADPRFREIDGDGIGVAVLDSGLMQTHALLDGNYVGGFDAVENDATPNDPNGHGTHVAGTIGAEDPRIGVAPEVDLLGVRVLDAQGSGRMDWIENGLRWVIQNQQRYNIQVVNMSLGGGAYGDPNDPQLRGDPLLDEVQRLEALGVTVVSAAGNSWKSLTDRGLGPNVGSPAIFSTIAVGGVWEDGAEGNFSWAGGATDFQTGPDRLMSISQRLDYDRMLFAPGALIESSTIDGGTGDMGGTSMASPMVAGMVALLQDAAQTFGGQYLSPAEAREILIATADPVVDGDDENDNVPNLGVAFPRANIHNAVQAVFDRFDADDPPPAPGETGEDPNGTLSTAIAGPSLGEAILVPDGATPQVVQLGDRDYTESIGRDGPSRVVGPADVDMYRFQVETDGVVTIETSAAAGDPADTVLSLFGANGQLIAQDDDSGGGAFSRIAASLTVGEYFVGVSGANNAGYDPTTTAGRTGGLPASEGSYRLSFGLAGGDPNGLLGGAVAVDFQGDDEPVFFPGQLGADLGEPVATADVDLFEIVAPDDGRVFVDIDTPFDPDGTVTVGFPEDDLPFADTVVSLFDADGAFIGSSDDAAATDRFLRPVEFDTDQTPSNGSIVTDANGQFLLGHDTDSFGWFDVARGERYYIGVSSFTAYGDRSQDPQAGYDPTTLAGRPAAEPDQFYQLFVNFINNDQNGSIPQALGANSASLDIGGAGVLVSGAVGTDGLRDENGLVFDGNGEVVLQQVGNRDVDFVQLVPQQSGLLEVDVDSFQDTNAIDETLLGPDDTPIGFEFDTTVTVFDEAGAELAFNDDADGLDARVNLEVTAGETYYVAVTGFGNEEFDPFRLGSGPGGETGRYTLTAQLRGEEILGSLSDGAADNAPVRTLALGAPVDGEVGVDGSLTLGADDVDMYSFTPSAAGLYAFRTDTRQAYDADTALRLFNAAGAEIGFNDNVGAGVASAITANLAAGQRYLIGVTGTGPNARAYDPLTGAGAGDATSLGAYRLVAASAVFDGANGVNDRLTGDIAANLLRGFSGNDVLDGGGGADTLDGGAGYDVATFAGARRAVGARLDGGASWGAADGASLAGVEGLIGSDFDDALIGSALANRIVGGDGADRLWGLAGDDVLVGGEEADRLDGGAGFDMVDYASAGRAAGIRLDGLASWGDAAGDVFANVEGAIGTRFADTLIGSTAGNRLSGGDGADRIWGLAGNDTLDGGAGADRLDGGAGIDTADYAAAAGAVGARLDGGASWAAAAGDAFFGVENLVGSRFGDALIGSNAANHLRGGAGNDRLFGLAGMDRLDGGAGADRLDGGAGFDAADYASAATGGGARLDGGANWGMAAGDVFLAIEGLAGSAFNDTLIGNAGSNTLEGRSGVDSLWGLAGGDRFLFTGPGFGADIVRDFEDGVDILDFSDHAGVSGLGDLALSQAGANVRIGAGADAVFLIGEALADITAADFDFG